MLTSSGADVASLRSPLPVRAAGPAFQSRAQVGMGGTSCLHGAPPSPPALIVRTWAPSVESGCAPGLCSPCSCTWGFPVITEGLKQALPVSLRPPPGLCQGPNPKITVSSPHCQQNPIMSPSEGRCVWTADSCGSVGWAPPPSHREGPLVPFLGGQHACVVGPVPSWGPATGN